MTWYQKFKESVFFRKVFFLAFVTSMILFRTLLNRNLWMNPLSDIMGGWGIWETVNGEQKLTTECIENVIMMVPFSAVVLWTFGEKIGNGWKEILWQSGKIAFIFSISIEMLQLLLRLGTFQLSDIFYNTPGHGRTARRTAGRKRACVSQNIRCQRHNRVFGQLPVSFSQQGDDTVCQAWAYPAFRHGGTQKVDAAAVCPGF